MCSCAHDAVKKPLQTPYDGPYLVLKRTEKMFTIEKNGKHSTINIDRLKPAFFENSHHSSAPIISPPPVAVPTSTKPVPDSSPSSPVSPTNSTPLPYVTRSGRRIRFNSPVLVSAPKLIRVLEEEIPTSRKQDVILIHSCLLVSYFKGIGNDSWCYFERDLANGKASEENYIGRWLLLERIM
ncbi:uncharacterized protein TNCT_712691 [Trichonephila clavata]|uniref:Uncharacterized protein n=1 Tax=Trichonephila clavata TaxID=2740835 RepID=A0A8X6J4Y5_TRICU|nr:uncharacterized protein TNCT_712691 [Trichonephila clavata]